MIWSVLRSIARNRGGNPEAKQVPGAIQGGNRGMLPYLGQNNMPITRPVGHYPGILDMIKAIIAGYRSACR